MKRNNEPQPEVLRKVARNDGMTVPEGYFEGFAEKMASRLPVQEWEKPAEERIEPPRSMWSRIRPYVYLAAMFAGIWCMMQIFTATPAGSGTDLNIGSRPELAQALSDPHFAEEYIYDDDMSRTEDDLMDTLWESGFDPSTL